MAISSVNATIVLYLMIIVSLCGCMIIFGFAFHTLTKSIDHNRKATNPVSKPLLFLSFLIYFVYFICCLIYGLFRTNFLLDSDFIVDHCQLIYCISLIAFAFGKLLLYQLFIYRLYIVFKGSVFAYDCKLLVSISGIVTILIVCYLFFWIFINFDEIGIENVEIDGYFDIHNNDNIDNIDNNNNNNSGVIQLCAMKPNRLGNMTSQVPLIIVCVSDVIASICILLMLIHKLNKLIKSIKKNCDLSPRSFPTNKYNNKNNKNNGNRNSVMSSKNIANTTDNNNNNNNNNNNGKLDSVHIRRPYIQHPMRPQTTSLTTGRFSFLNENTNTKNGKKNTSGHKKKNKKNNGNNGFFKASQDEIEEETVSFGHDDYNYNYNYRHEIRPPSPLRTQTKSAQNSTVNRESMIINEQSPLKVIRQYSDETNDFIKKAYYNESKTENSRNKKQRPRFLSNNSVLFTRSETQIVFKPPRLDLAKHGISYNNDNGDNNSRPKITRPQTQPHFGMRKYDTARDIGPATQASQVYSRYQKQSFSTYRRSPKRLSARFRHFLQKEYIDRMLPLIRLMRKQTILVLFAMLSSMLVYIGPLIVGIEITLISVPFDCLVNCIVSWFMFRFSNNVWNKCCVKIVCCNYCIVCCKPCIEHCFDKKFDINMNEKNEESNHQNGRNYSTNEMKHLFTCCDAAEYIMIDALDGIKYASQHVTRQLSNNLKFGRNSTSNINVKGGSNESVIDDGKDGDDEDEDDVNNDNDNDNGGGGIELVFGKENKSNVSSIVIKGINTKNLNLNVNGNNSARYSVIITPDTEIEDMKESMSEQEYKNNNKSNGIDIDDIDDTDGYTDTSIIVTESESMAHSSLNSDSLNSISNSDSNCTSISNLDDINVNKNSNDTTESQEQRHEHDTDSEQDKIEIEQESITVIYNDSDENVIENEQDDSDVERKEDMLDKMVCQETAKTNIGLEADINDNTILSRLSMTPNCVDISTPRLVDQMTLSITPKSKTTPTRSRSNIMHKQISPTGHSIKL